MDISDFFEASLGYLISATPALVFWIVVIVLVIIMLKDDKGRARRFLIIGTSLNITSSLLLIPAGAVNFWMYGQGYNISFTNLITTAIRVFIDVISMAGIICFIYAFWVKFKTKEAEEN